MTTTQGGHDVTQREQDTLRAVSVWCDPTGWTRGADVARAIGRSMSATTQRLNSARTVHGWVARTRRGRDTVYQLTEAGRAVLGGPEQ